MIIYIIEGGLMRRICRSANEKESFAFVQERGKRGAIGNRGEKRQRPLPGGALPFHPDGAKELITRDGKKESGRCFEARR